MKITIHNRQKAARVNREALRTLAEFLLCSAAPLAPARAWDEVIIFLTDNHEIRPVNRRHFQSGAITDVITLHYEPLPGCDSGWMGEIHLNVERALEQAASIARWSPSQELALYLAHACDHLMDQSDDSAAEARRMRKRELRWLRNAGSKGLLDKIMPRTPRLKSRNR
jgi:rRNA maturation RNase YbeY